MTINAPVLPPIERRAVLYAYLRALGSETHILDREPLLLWQQMYNRLQWEAQPIPQLLARALEQRARSRDPWLHQTTPSGESRALLRTLRGHTDAVRGCAVSPDGKRIASASTDKTVRLWDATTGRELVVCAGHTERVTSCVFTPDGARMISSSADNTLRIWDAETGAALAVLAGHSDAVHHCAISPDGAALVSASADQTLKVWDLNTGQEIGTLVGHSDQVIRCAFAPDGVRVVSTSWDRTVRLWHVGTLVEVLEPAHSRGEPAACLFTPDGSKVVWTTASDTNGSLTVWDVGDHVEMSVAPSEAVPEEAAIQRRITYGEPVITCAMSPDGQRIAISSFPNRLRLWDSTAVLDPPVDGYGNVSLNAELRLDDSHSGVTLKGHTIYPAACAFFPDGQHLVSASGDQTLRVWDLQEARNALPAPGQKGATRYCAFSPDRRRLVSLAIERYLYNTDGELKAWDAKTGSALEKLDQYSAYMVVGTHACAMSPDGQQMVSGISEGARLINANTGEKLAELASPVAGESRVVLRACAFTPGGEQFAAGYDNGSLAFWDSRQRTRLAQMRAHKRDIIACVYSPDGRRLVSLARERAAKIWDAHQHTLITTLEQQPDVTSACAYAPDSRRIATAHEDGTLAFWDDLTGERLIRLGTLPHNEASAVGAQCLFSPDGRQIVTCINDVSGDEAAEGTLWLWDTGSGVRLAVICERAAEGIEAAAFSPDARWLAWSTGQRLTFWNTRTHRVDATWYAGGTITALAFGAGGRSLAIGDSLGRLAFLELRHSPMRPPLTTLQFLYRTTEGTWDSEPTAVCDWCGARTSAEPRAVDAIKGVLRDASLAPYHSPAAELPTQAWREPALLAECRACHQPLRYNPYFVDNRERY